MRVHREDAQVLIEEIHALRQKVPNFVIPASRGERRKLARAASVPSEFVELIAVVVKNNPPLVRVGATDPERARDLMSYAEAYGPLVDEIETLAQFLRHSVTAAKNKAGSDALTTYALAQRLANRPEYAQLAPHVADMRPPRAELGPSLMRFSLRASGRLDAFARRRSRVAIPTTTSLGADGHDRLPVRPGDDQARHPRAGTARRP